jgi:transcriptional regulator with XRE-family HTH domain
MNNDRQNLTNEIGRKIKTLRNERGLTMEKLGQIVGCSKAYISQLEHGVTKPSLSMLNRFSEALGAPVSELLRKNLNGPGQRWALRKNERRKIQYPDGKVVTQLLTRSIFQKKMQPLVSSIKPGGSLDEKEGRLQHPPGSEEFVFVMKGELEFLLDGEIINLKEGDTLYFYGDLPHRWLNKSNKTAEVLFVWTPPVW